MVDIVMQMQPSAFRPGFLKMRHTLLVARGVVSSGMRKSKNLMHIPISEILFQSYLIPLSQDGDQWRIIYNSFRHVALHHI